MLLFFTIPIIVRRRKLLTPAFHYKILETTVRPIQKVADILVTRLEEQVEQMEFNIFPYMKLAALDAICGKLINYLIEGSYRLGYTGYEDNCAL